MDVDKPLKYFEVYTKQPDEDARAGVSCSSSKLQLVPKHGKHSSRQSSRLRINKGKSRSEAHDSSQPTATATSAPLRLTEDILAQHTALLPDERALPPCLKIQEPVRIKETMIVRVQNESSMLSTPAVGTGRSDRICTELPASPMNKYGKNSGPLPARLAVPTPFDIFAGPSSPVSAESLTNMAVSESHGVVQYATLSTKKGDQSLSPHHEGATGRERDETALNTQHAEDVNLAALSNTDTSFKTPTSISEITARCFAKQINPELEKKDKSDYSGILSIDDIVRQHQLPSPVFRTSLSASSPPVPTIPAKFRCETQRILSIEEIVSKHPPAEPSVRRAVQSAPLLESARRPRSRTTTEDSQISLGRSSIDSVTGEIMKSIEQQQVREDAKRLHHAKSQPSFSTPPSSRYRARQTSIFSDSPSESPSYSSTLPTSDSRYFRGTPTTDDEITRYIRSTRLTRLLTLRRPPNHHLVVSLADVGSEDGHPVVVFLGLGSVRYLVALYDDLAESLGLRLICIDRWGLGRTGVVPDARRGFREWSTIVEEVLDQLGVNKFSIVAHSAGTPYALASSIRLESRVHGAIQLLAPWVGSATESTANAYKWLKFVPSGVIKTAQAAEWKVQGWRLGKNPKLQAQGVGFDPRAPLSSESTASSPVFADFAATLTMPDSMDLRSRATSPTIPSESGDYTGLNDEAVNISFLSTPAQSRMRKLSMDTVGSPLSLNISDARPSRLARKGSTSSRATSIASPSVKSHTATPKASGKTDLGTAIMRASHAESLKGGTSDLLTILQKTSKVSDFSFAEVARPVRVWHGLKDDKISLQNVLTLETLIPDCKVNVIPGADHSLMTNVPVFVQVLQAIASEWDISSRL